VWSGTQQNITDYPALLMVDTCNDQVVECVIVERLQSRTEYTVEIDSEYTEELAV
jgi:flagellar assembly factor FliW